MMPENKIKHPGKILKTKFLDPLGITPYRLAKSLGIHVRRISELVKGNRSITPDTAMRLSLYFNVPVRWWLEMQARFDSENESRMKELRKIVKPYPKLEEVIVTPNGIRHLRKSEHQSNQSDRMIIGTEILKKLKAQALISEHKTERKTKVVVYKDGSRALIGRNN